MNKKEMQKKYLDDFEKMRGALLAQIANNSKLDQTLMERFAEDDFTLLEEHAALSKIILDSTKVLSEAYKYAPEIVTKIDETDTEEKEKINLDDLIKKEEK